MARNTTEKRRLIKFSNYSMCVTLPKWVVDQLEWKKGDQLTLTTDVKQGKITLFKEPSIQRPSKSTVDETSVSQPSTSEVPPAEATNETINPIEVPANSNVSSPAPEANSGLNNNSDTDLKPIPKLRW